MSYGALSGESPDHQDRIMVKFVTDFDTAAAPFHVLLI